MEENINQQGPQEEPKVEQKDTKGALSQLEAFLYEYMVKKAPFALPTGAKEFIVKVSPYLVIIMALLALSTIFTLLGLSAFLTPFAMMGGYGYMYGHGWGFGAIISLVVSIIVIVMYVIALPGLFKRTKGAWRLVFYATIVTLISSIISINGIVSGIIGAIIGWYILFQVKDLYKN